MSENIWKQAAKLEIPKKLKSLNFGEMWEFKKQNHTVRFEKRPGRTEVRCTCMIGTIYSNNMVLCKHRIRAIVEKYLKENDFKIIRGKE